MKNYNGFGGITKLKGKRRRPFWVRITIGWDVTPTGKAKQLTKTLGYYASKKDAMQALIEYHAAPMDLTKRDITFSEVYNIWAPKHFEKKPSTKGVMSSGFKKCAQLHNMKMIDIKTAHIQNVMDSIANTSESTQNSTKTVISKCFIYCMENDILQKNYADFVSITPKKTDISDKFFTTDEIKKIFENLDYVIQFPRGNKENFEMNLTDSIIILLYSGLRIGELLGIKIEDVNLEKGYIQINGTKNKNAKRVLPIHKDIIEIIKRNMYGEYLISYPDGKPILYQGYLRNFYKHYMAHLGFTVTPHATRHTFVTIANKCGFNEVALKKIVGHSNKDITEHYTHKELSDLIAEMSKFKLI